MDDQKPADWPAGRFGYPEVPGSGGQAATVADSPADDAADATDWAEMLSAGPGALWVVQPVEITQLEPEIPMPAELEAAAKVGDEQLEFMFGLLGVPPGSGIVTAACRAVWAEISAALMAYRRRCAAAAGANTELEYYADEPAPASRRRADDITDDLTVDNLARYHAHEANRARTRNVGHLGVPGRHQREENPQ